MKRTLWLIIALLCIAASIFTLFLPVVTYVVPLGGITLQNHEGAVPLDATAKVSLNILDFLKPEELRVVLAEYKGDHFLTIDNIVATILGVVAFLAIVAALVGVITMSRQRPNRWQFVLALVGIIGTTIPSLLIFVLLALSVNSFPGTFVPGIYPILTPITMVLCLLLVTSRHRRTQEELRAMEASRGLIYRGGDLR